LLAAISETVASNKGPWMQFSSLPINSSLQNNPRYQFSLNHFDEAIIFKMAANKIVKLSMVSDFNEHWYLGVLCSEELIGNDEIFIQGHFYEATIFKMATIWRFCRQPF
jgi:hypothetical protein